MADYGQSWADPKPMGGPGKYSVYSRTRIPTEYPKIPEPYTTLSETFSY